MEIKEKVQIIDALIRKNAWFDMGVFSFDGINLNIKGSIDLFSYYELEIIFLNCFHISTNMNWSTDTSIPVLVVVEGDEMIRFNVKHNVEIGYTLFKIIPEDIDTCFYVSAEDIQFKEGKVYFNDKKLLNE